MQKKIKIGAVSYINTKPLIYGFENGLMNDEIELILDYPSKLASLLQKNLIDIALLPVAAIQNIENANIFSDYCISSEVEVASVCIFSEVPIEEIQEIYLDYQSRTSIALLRILLNNYWNTRPILLDADEDYISKIKDKKAGVIIGDRALQQLNNFPYVYDLAKAWHDYTQQPFVFATWVANQELSEDFIRKFNEANAFGLQNINKIISNNAFPEYDLEKYYSQNINFIFDENKKNGMSMFLKLMEKV